MHQEIYLDGNATSPVFPAARDAAMAAMDTLFGNPSSTHASGVRAKAMMDEVRACAMRVLGVGDGQLAFVSGATEGIQTAVLSALCSVKAKRDQGEAVGSLLVYGATEHKAVPESLAHWNQVLGLGMELRALPVDEKGRHDLALLSEWLDQTALLCTMAANNETGVVSDLEGIERIFQAQQSTSLWLVDCVQALGKLDIVLSQTRIDYAPFSGHKLYAPKGIGMLYVRQGAPFTPLMKGGGQESGLRAGTENMVGIAALGAVLSALEAGNTFCSHAQLSRWRDRLAAALKRAFPALVFNTPFECALPTTLNFSVPGLSSKELLDLFDAAQVRVSAGSACSAAKSQPSYVLEAMGLPQWRTTSAVRMSMGPVVDDAFIDEACQRITQCGAIAQTLGRMATGQDAVPGARMPIIQFRADAVSSWLLVDPSTRSCIAVSPHVQTVDPIHQWLTRQAYRLVAVLDTGYKSTPSAQSLDLRAAHQITAQGSDDRAPLEFSGHNLVHFVTPEGAAFGLSANRAQPSTSYVFAQSVEALASLQQLGTWGEFSQSGDAATVTACLAHDPQGVFVAPSVSLVRGNTGSTKAHADTLQGADIAAFFKAHPDAQLVDVRESFEYAATQAVNETSVPAINVPLSELVGYAPQWLAKRTTPLVFVCRGGSRSAKALQTMLHLGHPNVLHIQGGLTLSGLGQ